MIKPEFRTSRVAKICFKLSNAFDHWVFKFIISPIFFIIPASILLKILSSSQLCTEFERVIGPAASKYLKESYLLAVFIVYGLLQGFKHINNIINHLSKPNSELNREDILSIINSINNIVASKKDRFLNETKQAVRENWDKTKIFERITQPEQQIALLIHGIKAVFDYLLKDEVDFRVGLMAVKDGRLVDWFAFAPTSHPPRTSVETLSSPSSTLMRSISTKGIVIVSDIKNELDKESKEIRNFVKGSIQPHEDGSILALPIYCPNVRKPVYVLSILGKKRNCLEEKHRELYRWILNHYIDRLILEHHLLLLKGVS